MRELRDIVDKVKRNIYGRLADQEGNNYNLAQIIAEAGDGDHVEIGTLFGGSAIIAAKVKEHCGHTGKIYCIDPLDGYYTQRFGKTENIYMDDESEKDVTLDSLRINLREYGLMNRVIVCQYYSDPWPNKVIPLEFNTAYIDGDHWGDMPIRDWLNVHHRVKKFVIFDNHDDRHPSVLTAARVAVDHCDWEKHLDKGITFAVRRKK